jgi:hypothetical protein
MAGVAAGLLGFCFWPRVEPSLLATRPSVEKPVFVVASAPRAAAPLPVIAVAAKSAPVEKVDVDKLAAALKASPVAPMSGPALNPAPANAQPSNPPSTSPAPSEEAGRFFAQGLVALASGDISSARLFLARAADSGEARALMALGDTYDESTLTRLGAIGMHGDESRARDLYARALAAGVGAAKERIAALESRGN